LEQTCSDLQAAQQCESENKSDMHEQLKFDLKFSSGKMENQHVNDVCIVYAISGVQCTPLKCISDNCI